MSDLKELKRKIYKDEKIIELLEHLGCHHITTEKGGVLITAARPDGDNTRSVQVRNNEELISDIRSRQVHGDIFNIVSHIKFGCKTEKEMTANLFQAKKWIIEKLGYSGFEFRDKRKPEINSWLKRIKKKRGRKIDIDSIEENEVLDESIKNEYFMIPHVKWLHEGILCSTQEEFECGFDPATNRIVVMIRNRYGQLIGVKGRTLDKRYEELGIPKYLYLYKMNKSIELYNLHKALPAILETKEIIIFEGYKSVMQAWQYGCRNCVSIEGDSISPAQVAIIKKLGLDVTITLCFDKDKTVKQIKEQAEKLSNRTVYGVYDVDGDLVEKQAPVDAGPIIWKKLYRDKLCIPIKNHLVYN